MRHGAGPYNQYLVECLRCAHSQTATTARTRGENRPRHSKRGNGRRPVRETRAAAQRGGRTKKNAPNADLVLFSPRSRRRSGRSTGRARRAGQGVAGTSSQSDPFLREAGVHGWFLSQSSNAGDRGRQTDRHAHPPVRARATEMSSRVFLADACTYSGYAVPGRLVY